MGRGAGGGGGTTMSRMMRGYHIDNDGKGKTTSTPGAKLSFNVGSNIKTSESAAAVASSDSAAPAVNSKFCTGCGAKREGASKFCGECGKMF